MIEGKKKTIILCFTLWASLSGAQANDERRISHAQEMNAELHINTDTINQLLDHQVRLKQAFEDLRKIDSSNKPSKYDEFTHKTDEFIEQLVEAHIRVHKNIVTLEKANNKCGLPPLILKGMEAAKPGAIAGGAYKAWLLQNAPGASEKLKLTLVEHGLIESRAISAATRVVRFLKSVSARATTVYIITFAAANAVIETMDDPDPAWCAYLADTSNGREVRPPTKSHRIIKAVLPGLVGATFVILFFWAHRRGLLRDERS